MAFATAREMPIERHISATTPAYLLERTIGGAAGNCRAIRIAIDEFLS